MRRFFFLHQLLLVTALSQAVKTQASDFNASMTAVPMDSSSWLKQFPDTQLQIWTAGLMMIWQVAGSYFNEVSNAFYSHGRKLDGNDDCGTDGAGWKCKNGNTRFECRSWREVRTCTRPPECTTHRRSDGTTYQTCTSGSTYDCSITHTTPVADSYQLCPWGEFSCRAGGNCLSIEQASDNGRFMLPALGQVNAILNVLAANNTISLIGTHFRGNNILTVGEGLLFPYGTDWWASENTTKAITTLLEGSKIALANYQAMRSNLLALAADNIKADAMTRFLADRNVQMALARWMFLSALPIVRWDKAMCQECVYFGIEFEVRLNKFLEEARITDATASDYTQMYSGGVYSHCAAMHIGHGTCKTERDLFGGKRNQLETQIRKRLNITDPQG